MTNEQQKAKELAELLTAFADGKQLEYYNDIDEVWCSYNITFLYSFMDAFANNKRKYRIKPEPKRVPLTMQDLIDRELSGKTVSLFYDDTVLHILKYNSQYVVLINGFNFDYEYLKNNYTFLDNTPCYKEVGDVA